MTSQNKNYWAERAKEENKWQEKIEKNLLFFNSILEGQYSNVIDEINKQIKADLIFSDGKTVPAKDMQEYENLAKQAVEKAKQLRASGHHVTRKDFSDDVNQRLKIYNATMRINRNEMLKSKIGAQLVKLGIDQENKLTSKLRNDYIQEKERQAGILGITAKSKLWTSKEVQQAIYAQVKGANFSKRIWANIDSLKAKLDSAVSTALIRGDNPREMARWLTNEVSKTVANQKYVTERLARTETARVQFTAEKQSIMDNNYKYVQWFAEAQACKVCREIADKDTEWGRGVYKVRDVPSIPVHPNCMCSISAYWLDEDERPVVPGESGAIKEEAQHIADFVPLLDNEPVAKKLYLEFAQRDKANSVQKIAEAGNLTIEDAEEIYNHIFVDKHLAKNANGIKKYAYFDPNFSMAQSFQRIFNGQKLKYRDKIMLKHELHERKLMKNNPNITYIEAHKLTNKLYDYESLTKRGE